MTPTEKEVYFGTVTRQSCAGGLRPPHMATMLGLPEVCNWLIASDCDVNERSGLGTSLCSALLTRRIIMFSRLHSDWISKLDPFDEADTQESRMEVLEVLIANGADCNASYRDGFGNEFSCSHLAFFHDIDRGADHPLIKLIAAGAQLEERLWKYLDDYMDRILEGKEFVEALVSALGTNQNHSIGLQMAFKLSSSCGFNLTKSYSTKFADMSIPELTDLFISATRFDQTKSMEELIQYGRLDISCKHGDLRKTFLHTAAEWNSIGAIRLLVSLGLNVNSIDDSSTPLHFATRGDASGRKEQCIILLLDHGANINAVDRWGCTVWHTAAFACRYYYSKPFIGTPWKRDPRAQHCEQRWFNTNICCSS